MLKSEEISASGLFHVIAPFFSYPSTNLSWRRLTLSSVNFPVKWPTPAFLPRTGQKREFRQNGWRWNLAGRLSSAIVRLCYIEIPVSHAPAPLDNPVPWAIPPFAGLLVDFCRSSNHLSRTFWIIYIGLILKYFPNSDRLSFLKFLRQFLDIKLVQNGFVHMAQRNIIHSHLATSGPCVRFQSS